eukprot:50154_1
MTTLVRSILISILANYNVILCQYAPIVNQLVDYVNSNESFALQLNKTFTEAGRGANSSSPMTYNKMYEFYNLWLSGMPEMNHCNLVSMSTQMTPFYLTATAHEILTYDIANEWFSNYLNEWKMFLDSTNSTEKIQEWEKCKLINMTEYKVPTNGIWSSFNSFFTRKIYPKYRPIASPNDSKIVTSPNDGQIACIQRNIDLSTKFVIKSIEYNLSAILNEDSYYIDRFVGGDSIQIFLEAFNYHRYHAPISGQIKEIQQIGGFYFVYETRLELNESIVPLFCDNFKFAANFNRRGIAYINDDKYGLKTVANVHIGVTEVSSVNYNVNIDSFVKKGDEIGYFAYGGSSILLIFEPNIINHFSVLPLDFVKMGQQIAVAN